jgi:hypothetical protein
LPAPAPVQWLHRRLSKCVRHLSQSLENSVVGRLGVEAAVEEQRVALGPPGVLVTNTPDGDTDTVLLVQASLDNVGPVRSLGVLDVDLGESALWGSSAESSHGSRSVSTLSGCQVTLGTDTVNGDTSGPPLLDVLDHSLGLSVVGAVQVVVVDVQLGVGVGLAGGLEGDPDEVLAENVVEHAGAEATVLLEHLVDDVPGVDLTLEMSNDTVDVVGHDSGQGGLVADLRDPAGKLRVPHGGVSTDELLVLGGKGDGLVSGAEVEFAARALRGVPLHAMMVVSIQCDKQ